MSENLDFPISNADLPQYLYEVYSTYFPIQVKGPITQEIEVTCPFSNRTRHKLTIQSGPTYFCSSCEIEGLATNFVGALELVPSDDAEKQIEALRGKLDAHENIPSMVELDAWSSNLLSPGCASIKNLLQNKYGLREPILKNMKIGYNGNGELVIPQFNGTGKGLAGAKYLKLDDQGDITGKRLVGYVPVYGLYELRQNPTKTVFFAADEFDVLALLQQGYSAVSPFRDTWSPYLAEIFAKKDVVFCLRPTDFKPEERLLLQADTLKYASSLRDLLTKGVESIVGLFVVQKMKKADLNKFIKDIEPVGPDYRSFLINLYQDTQKQQEKFDLNPAQDYLDGKMFFGIKLSDKTAVINSAGKVNVLDDMAASSSYRVKTVTPNIYNFTPAAVQEFVSGYRKTNPRQLFEKIREHLKKYIFLKEDNLYSVLSLWMIGTYVYRLFDAFPYLHVSVEPGSGKSTLLQVMTDIAFNGEMFVAPTFMTVLSKVDRNSSTLFLDEIEKLTNANASQLMAILNEGYKKGGKVSRAFGKKDRDYDTYSPKVFAGVNDISDTLYDRSIELRLLKKQKNEKAEAYHKDVAVKNFIARTRQELYVFGLANGPEIDKKYIANLSTLTFLDGLENRARERWAPILILADFVGDVDLMNDVKKYTDYDIQIHTAGKAIDKVLLGVIAGLKELLGNVQPVKKRGAFKCYITKEVLDFLVSAHPEIRKSIDSLNDLTKLLLKKGIEVKSENVKGQTKRCYRLDPSVVDDLAKRYSVES